MRRMLVASAIGLFAAGVSAAPIAGGRAIENVITAPTQVDLLPGWRERQRRIHHDRRWWKRWHHPHERRQQDQR